MKNETLIKEITDLTQQWYALIGPDHHKDRDCRIGNHSKDQDLGEVFGFLVKAARFQWGGSDLNGKPRELCKW